MSTTNDRDVDRRAKELLASMQSQNRWPSVMMFIAFLAFVYKMTELFVR